MADFRELDMEPLAVINLSNGESLELQRLTTMKIIKIAKFLAVDGMKIYDKYEKVVNDQDLSQVEKVADIVSELKEEQIIHLISILINVSDEEALKMDPFDHLEIITTYVEKIDIERAFTNVRKLMTKFNPQLWNKLGVQNPDANQ